jgi:hypothetical protein
VRRVWGGASGGQSADAVEVVASQLPVARSRGAERGRGGVRARGPKRNSVFSQLTDFFKLTQI